MAFQPGQFSWVELATTDDKGAGDFYVGLFGWTLQSSPMPDGTSYHRLMLGDKDVGGMFKMGARDTGLPPHWSCYLTVKHADATAQHVEEAGGKVIEKPFDVMDLGRMAVCQDPTGAIFQIWEAKKHTGAAAYHSGPGGWTWCELRTGELDAARKFYEKVFGWDSKVSTEYTEFKVGNVGEFAGMVQVDESWGPVPPHWAVYFDVSDCDATVARARELGATVVAGPMSLEHVGRFATLQDPQGAAFSIYQAKR
jgi:uncharacterized protein